MEKKFRCNLELSVKIDDSPLSESELENPDLKKIKQFISEFSKDPKAIKSYFKSLLIDTCFANDNDMFFPKISKLLGYQDFISLFFSIATKCPRDVAKFINGVYGESKAKQRGGSKNNIKTMEILDNHLGPIELLKASFDEIQTEDENK
jgi:hypothetical protein